MLVSWTKTFLYVLNAHNCTSVFIFSTEAKWLACRNSGLHVVGVVRFHVTHDIPNDNTLIKVSLVSKHDTN